jgi:tRNA(fMet)-specific endonuclease VapC
MVAEAYGTIHAALEEQGHRIGNNDMWIAAHALSLGVTLASNNDREFLRVTGLSVENWTK